MTKKSKIAFSIALLIAIATALYYFWGVYSPEITTPQIKKPLIATTHYVIAAIILILTIIMLAISHPNWFLPSLVFALLIVITVVIFESFENIPKITFHKSTTAETGVKSKTRKPASSEWKETERIVINFSRLKMKRFSQKLNFPIIPVFLNSKLETGDYRIKLTGSWEFFMSSGNWRQFPWQGRTLPNSLPEYRPDKEKEFCAVILLNNGEDITPVSDEGFLLTSTGSVSLSLKINLLMRADEFYSDRITDRASKLTLSNSEKEPLTIIIEKEVEK